MKYRITEEQLANLIETSTKKILSEAIEDEGIGSSIMQGLGAAAGKIRQHISNWGDSFRQGYNNNYANSNYGYGQNTQVGTDQTQVLQKLSTEIENMKQQISALEQGKQQQAAQPQATQQQATQPQATQPQAAQPKNKRVRKK